MGKIFCLMGKSSSGKDTIYRELFKRQDISLKKIIPYTTRPIREGEEEGREYHFCNEDQVAQFQNANKIVELRAYDTVYGVWKYFTVDDGQVDLADNSYLLIGTLETYVKIRQYYGAAQVVPVYIEVEDGERLLRAIAREKEQKIPKYTEMCRRFLADSEDFSEEKLKDAGVSVRFENEKLENTIDKVAAYIRQQVC
ncbi:guanylate kinase [Roseburia sp. MUC/MUC-530-WT-4D]|uniref:Guanylate kinase n=1 Tax=Roseburia porci TaxID=2605790 RepID=A0A6L5YMQ7_9FIRM|nr:guanylate kinase [Roseburia sp.]MDD6742528.1 guanylate kinase [Roseburia porci]MST73685.1 guanylate kinase [Roseburia porci]